MKKSFLLYAFCFAFSILVSTANIAAAKDLSLTITNKANEGVNVAICYLHDGDWIVEGWWNFKPNESAALEFSIDTPNIYLYGYGDEDLVWEGEKSDSNTKNMPIVLDEFKTILPAHPKGSGLKTVPFIYVNTEAYTEYEYVFER